MNESWRDRVYSSDALLQFGRALLFESIPNSSLVGSTLNRVLASVISLEILQPNGKAALQA